MIMGKEAPTPRHFQAMSSFHATAKQPPSARNMSDTTRYVKEKTGVPGGVFVTCLNSRTTSGAAAPTTPHANLYQDQLTSIGTAP
jgi:hypothetical protein